MSEQKNMKRNLYKKKSSGQKLSTPKNLKTNLYPKILRREISTKQSPKINLQKKTLIRLYQKTLSTKEIQRNSLPKNWKIYPIQFLPKRSLPKKNQGTMDLNFKYDLSNQSFIQISVKLRFDQSKFHQNFDWSDRSFIETSTARIEVTSKLRLVESKFHRNLDETPIG